MARHGTRQTAFVLQGTQATVFAGGGTLRGPELDQVTERFAPR
jgi:hypothetical protein